MNDGIGIGIMFWLCAGAVVQVATNHNLDYLLAFILAAALTFGTEYAGLAALRYGSKSYGAWLFWKSKTGDIVRISGVLAVTVVLFYRAPMASAGFYDPLTNQVIKFLGCFVYAAAVVSFLVTFGSMIPSINDKLEKLWRKQAGQPEPTGGSTWNPPPVPGGSTVVGFDRSRFSRK